MSNFFKRQAARESISDATVNDIGLDVVDQEEDVDAALLEVENDTQVIENLDLDAQYLDEDMAETEDRMEVLETEDEDAEDISEAHAEQIDVGQESIRERWGIEHRSIARECLTSPKSRRVVAHESLWEDIKAFFRRIREWFEQKLAALKDRWIKFHNAGKTIQKKSKKFDRMINALGQKDKDEIKGAWIEYCTFGGAFKPELLDLKNLSGFAATASEVTSELNGALKDVETDAASSTASTVPPTKKEKAKQKAAQTNKDAAKNILDFGENGQFGMNYVFKAEETDGDIQIVFEKVEDAEVPSEVPTPTISDLKKTNTLYNRVGVELEKSLQAWKKNGDERDRTIKAFKKLEDELDKKEKPENSELINAQRKIITAFRSVLSTIDRVNAHHVKCATKGLNGYLTAGIGAYKKSKN